MTLIGQVLDLREVQADHIKNQDMRLKVCLQWDRSVLHNSDGRRLVQPGLFPDLVAWPEQYRGSLARTSKSHIFEDKRDFL